MIAAVMMSTSLVLLLVGMVAGLAMGIQQDFVLVPAHTHLNLIGGVLLFLFGLYYRVTPAAAADRLARWQAGLHIFGAIFFPLGIALVLLNGHHLVALPIAGTFAVLAAIVLFLIIVLRHRGA
jgi:hypothetical protein